jgi:NAD(P)-dependent dehydrogenase (short-subunit alcohol dehydrogenase family)
MSDKQSILVTGGGRGLGRALVEHLVSLGHEVTFTVRSARAGDEVLSGLRAASARWHVLDLSSFQGIRSFAARLEPDVRFNGVVHVAGILSPPRTRRLTLDGIEETLAVNALAPFVLTHALLDRFVTAPRPARVVNVTSRLHAPGTRGAEVSFDFEDPNMERGYDPERAYKNSKLALLWVTRGLAKKVAATHLGAHAVCPGFVPLTAAANVHGLQRFLLRYVLTKMAFATSVEAATKSLAFTALDPSLDGSTGGYWIDCQPALASEQARDMAAAERFWSWAEKTTGEVWAAGPMRFDQ